MSQNSSDCPDCKFVTIIACRLGLADGGAKSVPAGQSGKFYAPRLRRQGICLYYRYEFKKQVFVEKTRTSYVRIPDSCKEVWFLYSDKELAQSALDEMRGKPEVCMQKLATAPGEKMVQISGRPTCTSYKISARFQPGWPGFPKALPMLSSNRLSLGKTN